MKKSCLVVSAAAAWLLVLSPSSTRGQILFSAGNYSNNCDSLGAASVPWVNNATMPGWYASKGSGDATNYIAGAGTVITGGIYSFGTNGTHASSDRALG